MSESKASVVCLKIIASKYQKNSFTYLDKNCLPFDQYFVLTTLCTVFKASCLLFPCACTHQQGCLSTDTSLKLQHQIQKIYVIVFIYLDTLYIIHIYVIYVKYMYVYIYFICMHRYFLNQCPFTWSDTLAALALNRYFEVHSVSRLGALTRLSIYYICMYVCVCVLHLRMYTVYAVYRTIRWQKLPGETDRFIFSWREASP